jgi:2-oxoglutarate ferredoxin oxidoreductase subunit gamma
MKQIRLSGSGGQGLILAGVIMAEAAVIEGKEVVQTQDYGPEARGGSSKAECIISDLEIDYPKVMVADVVLCMNQASYNQYGRDVHEQVSIIVDTTFVKEFEQHQNIMALPISKTAVEEFGRVLFANIIALGVIVGLTEVVSRKSIEKAVLARVPKGTEQLNRKALTVGWKMAKGLPIAEMEDGQEEEFHLIPEACIS